LPRVTTTDSSSRSRYKSVDCCSTRRHNHERETYSDSILAGRRKDFCRNFAVASIDAPRRCAPAWADVASFADKMRTSCRQFTALRSDHATLRMVSARAMAVRDVCVVGGGRLDRPRAKHELARARGLSDVPPHFGAEHF